MAQVRAFECDECGALGRASVVGEDDTASAAYYPPDDWYYVSVQQMGHDTEPAVVFCSERCMGYHFRPMQKRKGSQSEPEEEHLKE